MSSSTAATQQQHRPASPAQLDFARSLGLKVEDGQPAREVRRLISREVYRKGGQVLARLKPKAGDCFEHPRNGVSEISRINMDTRKVTLRIVSTGRKYVVDAAYFDSYPRVLSDAQLIWFLSALPRMADWCAEHHIEFKSDDMGRISWPKVGWEKARRIAGSQLASQKSPVS